MSPARRRAVLSSGGPARLDRGRRDGAGAVAHRVGRPGHGRRPPRPAGPHLADHAGRTVAVDLDGVDALDDTGLGVLLGAAGRARQAGGDLVVVCASEHLRARFTLTGLDRADHGDSALTSDGQLSTVRRPLPHRARRRLGRRRVVRGVRRQHPRAVARRRGLHPLLVRRAGRRDRATRFYADVDDAVVLRIDPEPAHEPRRGRGSRRHRRAVPPRLRADPGRRRRRGAPASPGAG